MQLEIELDALLARVSGQFMVRDADGEAIGHLVQSGEEATIVLRGRFEGAELKNRPSGQRVVAIFVPDKDQPCAAVQDPELRGAIHHQLFPDVPHLYAVPAREA